MCLATSAFQSPENINIPCCEILFAALSAVSSCILNLYMFIRTQRSVY